MSAALPLATPMLDPPVAPRDHAAGPAGARVTLVEYADFECPSCGAAHGVIQAVRRAFGDNLRLVFRHFPLRDSHPHALDAARAAEAAADRASSGRCTTGCSSGSTRSSRTISPGTPASSTSTWCAGAG